MLKKVLTEKKQPIIVETFPMIFLNLHSSAKFWGTIKKSKKFRRNLKSLISDFERQWQKIFSSRYSTDSGTILIFPHALKVLFCLVNCGAIRRQSFLQKLSSFDLLVMNKNCAKTFQNSKILCTKFQKNFPLLLFSLKMFQVAGHGTILTQIQSI